jgi:hypothetical protein
LTIDSIHCAVFSFSSQIVNHHHTHNTLAVQVAVNDNELFIAFGNNFVISQGLASFSFQVIATNGIKFETPAATFTLSQKFLEPHTTNQIFPFA